MLAGCTQEELTPAVSTGYGEPVTATLAIGMSSIPEVVVTKAASGDDYSGLNSLLLVFFTNDSDPKFVTILNTASGDVTLSSSGTEVSSNTYSHSGVQYTAKFTIESGTYNVVGLGNFTNVQRWTGSADGETSFTSCLNTLLTGLSNGDITYSEFLDEIFYISYEACISQGRTPTFNTDYVLSTGCSTITIPDPSATNSLTEVDATGELELYRGIANIEFKITSAAYTKGSMDNDGVASGDDDYGNIVTFTPSKYAVYNVPKGIRINPAAEGEFSTAVNASVSTAEGTTVTAADCYYDTGTYTIGLPSTETTTNDDETSTSTSYYKFDFFIPENMQEVVDLTSSDVDTGDITYSGYATREAWSGSYDATTGKKKWYYAPACATYVVIYGSYLETTSSDKNSSYSTIHSSITQHSIQTFYDPDHASTLNGFGLETYNETPLCSTFGSDYDYSADSGYSDTDGLANFELIFNYENSTNDLTTSSDVSWSKYIGTTDDEGNVIWPGWTTSVSSGNGDDRKLTSMYAAGDDFGAWYACLSRNRDLNGDGYIGETEVFWYLPAVQEYVLLMLGEDALSNECRLYFGDKSAMVHDSYPSAYLSNGAIYYTSSYGSNGRVFWPIERASYGAGTTYTSTNSLPLRCTRRLPVALEDHDCEISEVCTIKTTNATDPTSGNYVADLSNYFEKDVYRTSHIASGSLNPHNEDDVENKLYYGFVVPKYTSGNTIYEDAAYEGLDEDIANYGSDYAGSGYYYTQQKNITNYTAGDNICGDYYEKEDKSDKGAWRVPNQNELIIIIQNNDYLNPAYVGSKNNGAGLTCCTQFSNQNVRLGFQYASNFNCINTYNQTTGDDNSLKYYYIRCVRDATSDELTNSTVVTSNTLTTD